MASDLYHALTLYGSIRVGGRHDTEPSQDVVVVLPTGVEEALYEWSRTLTLTKEDIPLPPPNASFAVWVVTNAPSESDRALGLVMDPACFTLYTIGRAIASIGHAVQAHALNDKSGWRETCDVPTIAHGLAMANYAALALHPRGAGKALPLHKLNTTWRNVMKNRPTGVEPFAHPSSVWTVPFDEALLEVAKNLKNPVVTDMNNAINREVARAMTAPQRIAIIGGDDRIHRQVWPEGFTVNTYEADSYPRLIEAHQKVAFDAVILLTRWIAHHAYKKLRDVCGSILFTWNYGIPRLAKELPQFLMAPPDPVTSTLPVPSKADVDTATVTWGPGIRELVETMPDKAWEAGEIADFLDAPMADYAAVVNVVERMAKQGKLQVRPGPKYQAIPKLIEAAQPAPLPIPPAAEESKAHMPDVREKKKAEPKPAAQTQYLVTCGDEFFAACDSLEEALEYVTLKGTPATLWKRLKVRMRAELDE